MKIALGAFLRTDREENVNWLSVAFQNKYFEYCGALFQICQALVNAQFKFEIFILLCGLDVQSRTAPIEILRVFGVC